MGLCFLLKEICVSVVEFSVSFHEEHTKFITNSSQKAIKKSTRKGAFLFYSVIISVNAVESVFVIMITEGAVVLVNADGFTLFVLRIDHILGAYIDLVSA